MKHILLIVMLVTLMLVFVAAQNKSKLYNPKAEAEIERLMQDLNGAYLKGDKAAFDRIVADDWMITLSSGKVIENAKADEMSDIIPLDSSYILKNGDVKVRFYGRDVAVVSRLITDKGKYMGQDIDRVSRSTDVVAKRNGRWQVVSTHLTRITPLQTPPDLSDVFKDTTGAFVLYDLKNNRYIRYNGQRCRERFSPKSTFKIPNSLIGLETGVIRDADFVIQWNRQKYPPQDNWDTEPFNHWGQDQTLRSAIKYSVVWYYRELALRVGETQMKKFATAFNYGNQDVSGRIDDFWLNGTLQISADEQIEFLKAFYAGRLPVSKRSTDIVKDILVLEVTPTYKLSGKTGGGSITDEKYIGWFVGYLETGGNVYFFATNVEGANFSDIRDKRVEVTKQALTKLGYLSK